MGRKQKIHLRPKARAERRHRFLKIFQWLIVLGVLGAGMRLGAQRAARTSFFPIKTLQADISSSKSTGAYASWRDLAGAQMEKAWKNKNRITFTRDVFTLRRQMLDQYPFIREMNVHWWDLLRRGDLRVTFSFRNPAAIRREKGKVSCLDADLVSFPCPSELVPEGNLLSISGLEGGLLKLTLQRFRAVQEALPQQEKITHAESVGGEAVVFKSDGGKDYRLNRRVLASSNVLEIVLDRLKTVLLDLRSRQEVYDAVDLTLAEGEGRVMVALKP